MKLVRPVSINGATLLSSNVPANDANAWIPGASYGLGANVIRYNHIYESLTASNTASPGDETTQPFKWQDKGAINRWRMFDRRIGKKWLIGLYTENPDSIDITIQPGRVVNAIGLVGVKAKSVQVIMTDPIEGVVYDKTVSMIDTGVSTIYDWFFAPFTHRENLALLDLPAYGTATVRVIARYTGSKARIGMLVVGDQVEIGYACMGTGVGYNSYSKIRDDDFGNPTITSLNSSAVVDFDIRIESESEASIMRTLNSLKDTAVLYIGSQKREMTIIIGVYEKLYAVIVSQPFLSMALKVRSLS